MARHQPQHRAGRRRRSRRGWALPAATALIVASALGGLASAPAGAATSGPDTAVLDQGQVLTAGQSLTSPDGRFTLVMQTDGNLVLYWGANALWSSGTAGSTGDHATLQTDGNLVVYLGTKALWNSHTFGADSLDLQSDGNLVVYASSGAALWSTRTEQAPVVTTGSQLPSNSELAEGDQLTADAGRFSLVDQSDGNIVLYEGSLALWSTRTFHPGDILRMQSDGNLVVYYRTTAVWHSSTSGHTGADAVLQGDGNLVVYGGTVALWNSRTMQPDTGVGIYGGYGTEALATTAIRDGWPIVADTGALGIPSSPYTAELGSAPDANVADALASSGSNATWLSFWTVSGPTGGDTWTDAGTVAGATAARELDSLAKRPSYVILDPEGYNGYPQTPAEWTQFLDGWAQGIDSVNAALHPAFYANQSEYTDGDLSTIDLPAFIAVSPILFDDGTANAPYVSGPNIVGYSAYYTGCSADPYVQAAAAWGAPYDTMQFSDSGVDCAP